ncbi:glycosyltransferase family 2 protein [Arcticibacter sp. MXS-1]|uniref:glycosyltransferase family 2 protein n=1 Tax=Arcticibacter sp. MXS-1 TaxID=3341726 RepID=UPI0035A96F62
MISVIIPVYNGEETIVRAVVSVLSQTNQDFELVVVNDGSIDGTEQVLKELIKSLAPDISSKIRYFYKENSGPSDSRNFGITRSNGSYIAFLDADDEWIEDKLAVQIKLFEKYPKVALIGADLFFGTRVNRIRTRIVPIRKLLFKNYFTTSTVIARSSVFRKYVFNKKQKYSEDYRLWLEICCEFKCMHVRYPVAKHQKRKHLFGDSGLSAQLNKMEFGELSNYFDLFKADKISWYLWLLASIYSIIKYCRRILLTRCRKLVG